MASVTPSHLSPRKRPRQARASATVDVIFEATVQLLLAIGPQRLTTTRVAKRAGVSVGTLYQYFPHKQALIYALNERYLEELAEKIEVACRSMRGATYDEMIEALIETYWSSKTERMDVTKALYRSVVELDNQALIDAFAARVDAASVAMFAGASDARIANLEDVSLTVITVVFGAVRHAFERNLTPAAVEALRRQVTLMARAYLQVASTEGDVLQKTA